MVYIDTCKIYPNQTDTLLYLSHYEDSGTTAEHVVMFCIFSASHEKVLLIQGYPVGC